MSTTLKGTETPVALVRQFADDFNRGDGAAMASRFARSAFILDGLPPHVWQGEAACEEWYRDVMAASEHEGATEYVVTLGEPLHADQRDDAAYIVSPASMSFKLHGKAVTQSEAVFTTALRKTSEGWRLTAWAWSKGISRTE